MKKVKEFYLNNRVFVILMTIVLICLIIMGICLLRYFYGNKNDNPYGARVDGIENVEITDSRRTEIENKYKADEGIETISVHLEGPNGYVGPIIYIDILFNNKVTLEEAKTKAAAMVDEFSKDEQNFYDIHFTIKQKKSDTTEGFLISGAKNSHGNQSWNNNLEVTESEITKESDNATK